MNFRKMQLDIDYENRREFPRDFFVSFQTVSMNGTGETTFKLLVRLEEDVAYGYSNECTVNTYGATEEQLLELKHNVLLKCLIDMKIMLLDKQLIKHTTTQQLDIFASELLTEIELKRINQLQTMMEMLKIEQENMLHSQEFTETQE